MLTSQDFKDLLNLFKEHNVRYLIVGGYAVMRYSEPRFTKDLDLFISVDETNAQAVFKALREFGAPLKDLTEQDFSEEGFFYQMGQPPLRVDILMSVDGITFDEAWTNREVVEVDGAEMVFISKADLIKGKKASGRKQDLLDLDSLS